MTGPYLDPDQLAAATEADRRDHLSGGLTALVCGRCGGAVRARMHSRTQLAMQWSSEAVGRCRDYTSRDGCPYLRRALVEAVADGRLPVTGPAGDRSSAGSAGSADSADLADSAAEPDGLVCPGG
ncbi:MAG TPA: hypothetical protein VGH89_30460 [Pseudonocardia sp.]|jgi:hypothetical protein